ncbi:hypothetical protein GCM10009730_09270 [Streptomyces albidochromogenes]|uniref:hypothetical protein n=1 Tax=Streptomyces albidochromogenes TaxID=329524 RepID=UPI002FE860A6
MNATQQHMLDVYRAAQLGQPAPPAPGQGDWQVVREIRDYRLLGAAAAGRPPRPGRLRAALTGLFASAARGRGARAGRTRAVAGSGSGASG